MNLFGDVEQKYQNSSQLCDWSAGVLPADLVNLPAIITATQLAGIAASRMAGINRGRSLETGIDGSAAFCELGTGSP